jgi:2-succinyl-5-enolpyruvyl-6-hydroxy-3-cyclohexene-1-carboxylate synthase
MNQLWGYIIVEELIRNGVDYFVISPGSRSTPLTVAVAQNLQAKKIICLDERAAGFHAIGYARATGNPAVLICTSGTAAANYLPAVIEASIDNIPLIILASDRPPELRQTGANQTINQVNLYGDYPTWQFDLPCPTVEINPNVVLTTIDLAVSKARQAPGGVVHLNCMFREPLAPTDAPVEIPASLMKWHDRRFSVGEATSAKAEATPTTTLPYTRYASKLTIPTPDEIESLIEIIQSTTKGVLVVGQLKSIVDVKAVVELALRLNWAVFADIQSGLRLRRDFPNLIHYFDRLLLTDISVELEQIDTIVQIGTKIVSAQWFKWIDRHPPTNYIAIANNPERYDPSHLVSLRIESDITYLCQHLSTQLPQLPPSTWVQKLRSASDRISVTAAKFLKTSKLTEPLVALTISECIPNRHGLWVANSMPIRDLDMFGVGVVAEDSQSLNPRVGANRGTSGIEGAIASATGFAAGLQAPVTAIVGDLSSLHDLNSLALLPRNSQPVIVVIINNDGGGIFSFLPISKSTQIFDTYFGTPHGVNFCHAAAMFELDYYHPQHREELIQVYTQALAARRSAIIEVTTDRTENLQLHQDLNRAIQQQFDDLAI